MYGLMVPKKFFVASGKAINAISGLNAFDEALLNAKIGDQNLVPVSSILPVGIKKIDPVEIPMGAITHCILSQMRGGKEKIISAGLSYAFNEEGGGYVAEVHGYIKKEDAKELLDQKIGEMARRRDKEIKEISYVVEELYVPLNHYGACVAAIIFI